MRFIAFHNDSANVKNHRFRSWEHCNSFFRDNRDRLNDENLVDHASLHLAFYLASWGMLRNSFLLQRDYRVHKKFVKDVATKKDYADLLSGRILNLSKIEDINLLESLIEDTRAAYLPILCEVNGGSMQQGKISDTLTSKILLGVFGVIPAYDRYFREAAGFHGINKQFNNKSFEQLQNFYCHFEEEFVSFIEETVSDTIRYTPMKVLDMYFWKVGELLANGKDAEQKESLIAFILHVEGKLQSTKEENSAIVTKSGNKTEDIRRNIAMILQTEKAAGQQSSIICACDIHKDFNLSNSYPSVCSAMGSISGYEKYDVIYAPPSGKSSTVTYRYWMEGRYVNVDDKSKEESI